MDGRRVADNVDNRAAEHREPCPRVGAVLDPPREIQGHLLAVVVAERRGIEVQQRSVEPLAPHQAFLGTSPRARAIFTSWVSRAVSTSATRVPNAVMR